MTVSGSVLELIGNTPLVDITELSPNPAVRILIKLEGQNPGGSVKDRIALSMIEEAEKEGILEPGQILIEPSSGNTGIGMALVCRLKGYHLKVVLATNVSIERRQLIEVWGAEIIESPGAEGSNGAVRRARALAAEHPEWVFLYQYANPAGLPRGHPLRGRARHIRHAARCGPLSQGAEPGGEGVGHRTARRRVGRWAP
jgi:[CysO sulfur-carrier protein]-thiocarboxylate-dependent cysteine synthase